jgi:hypothetical protein
VQADGKIIVGGSFGSLGGQVISRIGRLNADGTLDNIFTTAANNLVVSTVLQSDGKCLVGGIFTTLGTMHRISIGRLGNTDPATESLTYDGTNITWLRAGTLPEVWRTTFEQSADGTNWMMLGGGTRIAGGWSLTGVAITNGTIRARGYSGGSGSSSGLVESSSFSSLLISSQPVNLSINSGQNATFGVGVVGSLPLKYQWFKGNTALTDGGNVSGSTSSALSLSNVQPSDSTNYYVVVSNNWGSVTSQMAQLTVTLPPPPLVIGTGGIGFGFKNQQFQFTLTGPVGSNAVIYASPDLQTWAPLYTNPLVNGSLIFTDLLSTNFTQRFYRAILTP